jgi:hypothetical protein
VRVLKIAYPVPREYSTEALTCLIASRGRGNGCWQGLCAPKTSSKSCDQAIFIDQTTDANVFSDAELLKIDRLG